MDAPVSQFDRHNYLNLETFKRSGQGVKTPVWFVRDGSMLYVRTDAKSWKVKRVRNTARVRVVPSDAQGKPLGEWVDATARLVEGEEADHANRLAKHKYGATKIGLDLLHRLQGHRWATIRIDLPGVEAR
jgi:PPOX class probable F420-dependent enzyme